jgi:sirohydrochlorin ferrochelatase
MNGIASHVSEPGGPRPLPMIAAAHGTRSEAGTATIRALLRRIQGLRPQTPVVEAWVDVRAPSVADALGTLPGPAIVVPLLLGAGYHVRIDLPGVLAGRPDVALAEPLGPHPAIVDVLAQRLAEARAAAGAADRSPEAAQRRVVLAYAGSSDPQAESDATQSASLLRQLLGGRGISVGALTGAGRRLDAVLDELADAAGQGADRGRTEPLEIANYLLADGFFADRLAAAAAERGVAVCAAPLGDHPALADLAWLRYDDAARRLASSGGM